MKNIFDIISKLLVAKKDSSDDDSKLNYKALITKENMLVLFLGGVLIYIIMLPTKTDTTTYREKRDNDSNIYFTETECNSLDNEAEITDKETISDKEYQHQLEKELEEFLKNIDGIGEVKTLIYLSASKKYVVEKDIPTSNTIRNDTSENTKNEKTVYTANSSGKDVPFVIQTINPKIEGVVIAAQGIVSEEMRIKIIKLVMTLYGIDANKIEVINLK